MRSAAVQQCSSFPFLHLISLIAIANAKDAAADDGRRTAHAHWEIVAGEICPVPRPFQKQSFHHSLKHSAARRSSVSPTAVLRSLPSV